MASVMICGAGRVVKEHPRSRQILKVWWISTSIVQCRYVFFRVFFLYVSLHVADFVRHRVGVGLLGLRRRVLRC